MHSSSLEGEDMQVSLDMSEDKGIRDGVVKLPSLTCWDLLERKSSNKIVVSMWVPVKVGIKVL